MAFSGAQAASWDGSTLLLDAGGMSSPVSKSLADPSSLDALLFDVDDAECAPSRSDNGTFAAPDAPLAPTAVLPSTGHMYKTYPAGQTRPRSARRVVSAPAARGKWPWPLRSERSGRVPQKEQRALLAQDVQDMEEFVAELSASRSVSAAGDHETIAAMRVQREREAKREAECRNQRLRQLNSEHAKRLKRIDRVVAQSLSDYDQLRVSERLEYNEEKDAALYHALYASQDEQMEQMEAMLQAAGLTRETKNVERAQVVTDDQGGAYIRFVDARLAPFPMMTMLRAMRRYHRRYTTKYDEPFGAMAVKARFILRDTDAAATKPMPLDSRGVGKIVPDGSDSARGIWSGQGEWPPEYTPGAIASLPIREKGWTRMRELRSPSGQTFTIIQSCLHMWPGLAGADSAPTMSAECVAMLADVIIPSYLRIVRGRHQTMENAFVDELMREQRLGGSATNQAGGKSR